MTRNGLLRSTKCRHRHRDTCFLQQRGLVGQQTQDEWKFRRRYYWQRDRMTRSFWLSDLVSAFRKDIPAVVLASARQWCAHSALWIIYQVARTMCQINFMIAVHHVPLGGPDRLKKQVVSPCLVPWLHADSDATDKWLTPSRASRQSSPLWTSPIVIAFLNSVVSFN